MLRGVLRPGSLKFVFLGGIPRLGSLKVFIYMASQGSAAESLIDLTREADMLRAANQDGRLQVSWQCQLYILYRVRGPIMFVSESCRPFERMRLRKVINRVGKRLQKTV